jgi:integrase
VKVRYRKGPAVTVYRKTAKYPFYRIAYKADGRRLVRSFQTYAAARREAEAKARELHAGNAVGASLPRAAAHAYTFALRKLADLARDLAASCTDPAAPAFPVSLEDAITEYVEAKRALGPAPLVEAVRAHLARAGSVRRVKLADAAAEFLKEREARTRPEKEGARPKLSTTMFIQDRLRMERFTDAFQMDLCDLRAEHLDLFFGTHLGKLSPKSRNHYRGTVGLFIKWAVRRKYLPKDHGLHESEGFCPGGKFSESVDTGNVELYTADEFARLLVSADDSVRPVVALQGLAGLRTAEVRRLEWGDVWRRPGYIEVGALKAKTRSRRLVPISPALAAWLAPCRNRADGRVWPFEENKFHGTMRELADTAKVPRRENALRHSFITYRLAEVHNEHQVAHEAGNSPAMIHRHYRELATAEEAKAWFNVLPDGAATNVVSAPTGKEAVA